MDVKQNKNCNGMCLIFSNSTVFYGLESWLHTQTHIFNLTMRNGFKQLSILIARLCGCVWNHMITNHKKLSILKKLRTWHRIFLFLVVFSFSLITNLTSVYITFVYQIVCYK